MPGEEARADMVWFWEDDAEWDTTIEQRPKLAYFKLGQQQLFHGPPLKSNGEHRC